MKEIFDFIEDASCALDLLSRYYTISYDESKIAYSEDGIMIDYGRTEEVGWKDGDIYSMFPNEDGSKYTFNDACEQLIDKYDDAIDIFSENNKYDGKYFTSLIEIQFLKIDEVQRKALIKKIVRSSFIFILPNSYPLYEIIQPDNTYGLYAHRCFMSDEEEMEEYEKKDEIGMYKALPVVSWLIDECCILLNGVGTLCSDYDINLIDMVKSVFSYTTLPLRLDVFGDDIKLLKNDHDQPLKENHLNSIEFSDNGIVEKLYDICNGVQWRSIDFKLFCDTINSNGKTNHIEIKKHEATRTKIIFKLLYKYMKDEEKKKQWKSEIEKNIFDERCDILKASLQPLESKNDEEFAKKISSF